ncbi:AAA family ATPase [Candidatus Margulisiibacteriota bacterium]
MNTVLYEKNAGIVSNIKDNLAEEHRINKVLRNEDELIKVMNTEKPDLLIININEINDAVRDALKNQNLYVLAISPDASADIFKQSLALGAKDFLTLPINKNDLNIALRKAYHYIANIQAMEKSASKNFAKVTTFLSSKGGVGKSLLATNLAFLLHKEFNYKVLLIDTVPRFGNLDILIDINEKKNMGLISLEINDYDALWQDIEDNIITHASGLHLLTAGEKNQETIPLQSLKTILNSVKDKYDHIIIDTENYFNDLNLSLLELSDQVFFISNFDIASIKNLNLGLQTIKSLYFSTEKIKIVVNRYDAKSELTIAEMEKYLKFKVSVLVPEDRETVLRSINRGIPFVQEATTAEIYNAVKRLADCLLGKSGKLKVPETDKKAAKSSWLNNFVHIFKEK